MKNLTEEFIELQERYIPFVLWAGTKYELCEKGLHPKWFVVTSNYANVECKIRYNPTTIVIINNNYFYEAGRERAVKWLDILYYLKDLNHKLNFNKLEYVPPEQLISTIERCLKLQVFM